MTKNITLAHGNGGEENNELIEGVFYKHLKNDYLKKSEDASLIEGGRLAFTTDSFTISPLFFSGGDIGKLSICGTCNDLAMMGAAPKYVTLAMMIEEGFEMNSYKLTYASALLFKIKLENDDVEYEEIVIEETYKEEA